MLGEDLEDLQDLADLQDLEDLQKLHTLYSYMQNINEIENNFQPSSPSSIDFEKNYKVVDNNIVKELHFEDDKSFRNFTRMSISQFEELLGLIEPHFEEYPSFTPDTLTPYTRLVLTLRYRFF